MRSRPPRSQRPKRRPAKSKLVSWSKRSAVEDRDKKWKGLVKALAAADGLELRAGIMNWKLRYPKSGAGTKGTEIAKVAGILQIYAAISAGYDSQRGTIDAAFQRLHTALIEGKVDIAELMYRSMGIPLREAMRKQAMQVVSRRTGRMERAIRATVFENVRVGRKGPMHAGEVAAGDDPLKPKATEKIS